MNWLMRPQKAVLLVLERRRRSPLQICSSSNWFFGEKRWPCVERERERERERDRQAEESG